jgi:hypothetical protein
LISPGSSESSYVVVLILIEFIIIRHGRTESFDSMRPQVKPEKSKCP